MTCIPKLRAYDCKWYWESVSRDSADIDRLDHPIGDTILNENRTRDGRPKHYHHGSENARLKH